MGLFSTEYFFGLEILRFFFLLAIFAEFITLRKELFGKVTYSWLPYFCIWILNAAWTYAIITLRRTTSVPHKPSFQRVVLSTRDWE